MIEIKNQQDFDTFLVAKAKTATLPENEIIRIYPTETAYQVMEPIVITQSNIILQGYGKVRPALEYRGASQSGNSGILYFKGTSSTPLEKLIVENLMLDGIDKSKTNVRGIYAYYCGLAQTTGLSAGGYDYTTVGKDKPNKIGTTIRNCVVQNNNGYGIYTNLSSNSTITENTAQNNNGSGIYLGASSNSTITGNTVQNNGDYGIYLGPSSNNCVVTGNTVQNHGTAGIKLYTSNNSTVTKNSVQNNSNNGIYLEFSNDNTVTANTVQNNNGSGIYLEFSNNNTVTGNVILGNKVNGIVNNLNSSSNVFMANIIVHGSGLHINSAGNYALILGNQMLGTGTGISMSGTGPKQVDNIKGA